LLKRLVGGTVTDTPDGSNLDDLSIKANSRELKGAPYSVAESSVVGSGSSAPGREWFLMDGMCQPRKGSAMSGPFIFIATNRLKAGRLEDEKKRVPGLAEFIEANEPRLIAFNEYANEEGTEVGVVQVHPDTDSMEFHMQVVRERAERAYAETLDFTTSIQLYGTPTQAILEMLSRTAGSDVPVTVKPDIWAASRVGR
jgi:hypothetical protein